jgi:hypothetical protein
MKRSSPFDPRLMVGGVAVLGLVLASIARADAPQTSQPRSVGEFRGLDLAGTIGVDVALGKAISVEVSGDADLVDKVKTAVADGTLVISTPELRNMNRRDTHLHATVTAPDLGKISISGTGAIKVTGIANDELLLDLSGTGALTAVGSTGLLKVRVGGTGEVSGKDLNARDLRVDIGGTGSARLNATRSVEARVTGTGSVSVHGHPTQVKKSVSGVGHVHIE